jgi:hypothetical protein
MTLSPFRRRNLKRKHRSTSMLGKRRRYRRPHALLLEGRNAWNGWLEHLANEQISLLEDGSAPHAKLDTDRPWWCMALTTEPIFLQTSERASCAMLMGLCPYGHPGVDWGKVVDLAPKIFDRLALLAGEKTQLHLCPFDIDSTDDTLGSLGQRHTRLGGRCFVAMPGYESEDLFQSLSRDEHAFDRRRARRRARKDVPISWETSYGAACASSLWVAGFAPSQTLAERFDDWAASLHSLAQAMIEAGASRVELVPDFFARMPQAMDDENLAPIDAGRLDPLRQRWDIEACSQADSGSFWPKRRSHSI